jgi:hypothetical protein
MSINKNFNFRFKLYIKNAEFLPFEVNDEVKKEEEAFSPYMKQAEKMKFSDRRTMYVDMNHFCEFDINYEFRDLILSEYTRYVIIKINFLDLSHI